jgi:hypothetical protein
MRPDSVVGNVTRLLVGLWFDAQQVCIMFLYCKVTSLAPAHLPVQKELGKNSQT